MPAIPAVDHSADYQFVSRSAGNTPEKIREALEGEGIFVKDITEQTDEAPAIAEEKPVEETPASSEKTPQKPAEEPKPGETETPEPPTAVQTEEQKAEEQRKKAAPGVKERQKQKIGELTNKLTTVEAERETERQKRESLERELAEYKAGKSTPKPESVETPTTVVKTEEKPAEPKARPARPKAPKEEDFWEKEDPTAAFKAAQAEHETAIENYDDELTDWRLDERERIKREKEATDRQKEATENFQTRNAADQKERADRWKLQATEAAAKHPDFQEKLTAAKPFSAAMIEAAHAMDQTAEIGYYLATHPEIAERITKETDLPKNPTQGQVNKAMKKTFLEFARIEAEIAAAAPVEVVDEDDADEKEIPEAPAEKPTEKPKEETPVVPKKFTPVTPVGGRGGKSHKTLAELQKSNAKEDMEELRKMPLDEMRRRQKEGT